MYKLQNDPKTVRFNDVIAVVTYLNKKIAKQWNYDNLQYNQGAPIPNLYRIDTVRKHQERKYVFKGSQEKSGNVTKLY